MSRRFTFSSQFLCKSEVFSNQHAIISDVVLFLSLLFSSVGTVGIVSDSDKMLRGSFYTNQYSPVAGLPNTLPDVSFYQCLLLQLQIHRAFLLFQRSSSLLTSIFKMAAIGTSHVNPAG